MVVVVVVVGRSGDGPQTVYHCRRHLFLLFGELPELWELKKFGQVMNGSPGECSVVKGIELGLNIS